VNPRNQLLAMKAPSEGSPANGEYDPWRIPGGVVIVYPRAQSPGVARTTRGVATLVEEDRMNESSDQRLTPTPYNAAAHERAKEAMRSADTEGIDIGSTADDSLKPRWIKVTERQREAVVCAAIANEREHTGAWAPELREIAAAWDAQDNDIDAALAELKHLRRNSPARRLTHGRHCACSACARQDWSEPDLAPCGMHGPSCPPVYDPWGVP
jgi:hypothetical protein